MEDGTRGIEAPGPGRGAQPPTADARRTGGIRADGRRERSAESRRRILAAGIRLVETGVHAPTAEQIASEAGVSLRTLFRHFEDMDRLSLEIVTALLERLRPPPTAEDPGPDGERDWPRRLETLLEQSVSAYERFLSCYPALELHRHRSPEIARRIAETAASWSRRLSEAMPGQLRGSGARMALLALLLSPEAWQRLRVTQGLSEADARAALRAGLAAAAGQPLAN